MKLSILIPIYNLPELTRRCLDSIPYDEDIEVIAIDDCSTDDMSFLKDYEDRAKILYNEKNLGTGTTRNMLLDLCQGDYIFGMDNDDYLLTENFRKAIKELDGTDMVYIDVRVNSGDVWRLNPSSRGVLCAFWSKFIRRDFTNGLRCIDDHGEFNGDWYFTDELLKRPHTEKYTNIVAYHYNFPRRNSLIWKKNHGIL